MNELYTLAAGSGETPGMVKIIFWILLLLWALGAFWVSNPPNPNVVRGTNVVILILLGILGWAALGF